MYLFTFDLANYNCKIKITSVSDGEPAVGGKVIISREEDGDDTWVVIYTKYIWTASDFDYTFVDRYTLSNRTYNYKIDRYTGDESTGWIYEDSTESSIECSFDGIYIYDASNEYILELNLDYDFDNNLGVFYQPLLQSKYPIRVQNGLSDYKTGYVEALPLPKDSNNCYTTDGAYLYKLNYISWLRNSLSKYIKTWKGDAIYVSVDPGVKLNQSNAPGADTVRFTFTEIDDAPTYDE